MDEQQKDTVVRVEKLPDEVFAELVKMEEELFPEHLRADEEEIRELFEDPENVHIIAFDPEGRVAGYILSEKHNKVREELKDADPNMEEIGDALYLSSIAIKSEHQGKGYFSKLMKKFLEHRGGKPVSMHSRTSNESHKKMQKYGATSIRSIEDWHGSGEPFDYLIIPGEDSPKES